MLQDQELIVLLGRVALGDRSAFQRLYEDMAPRVFALCLRLLRRHELAEEVLQDTFVRLWHHAGEYHEERGSAGGWMLTIARYRALDVLRRQRHETELDEEALATIPDERPNPHEAWLQGSAALALQGCLEELSDSQRVSILRAYYQGMSHEELAVAMAAPLGTVKSWVRRGLQSLKRCLEA